jgi:hypothetical protein
MDLLFVREEDDNPHVLCSSFVRDAMISNGKHDFTPASFDSQRETLQNSEGIMCSLVRQYKK